MVFLGGPVSDDRLFYIHNLGPDIISDCDEYFPGLYAGGSFRDVLNYVNSGYPVDGRIRFLSVTADGRQVNLRKSFSMRCGLLLICMVIRLKCYGG